MRSLTLAVLSVTALSFLAGPVRADWTQTDGGWVYKADVEAVRIPAGFHAHTTTDGGTIVHADSNVGNAAAHAGVALPWPKTGFPGEVVAGPFRSAASDCPGGRCPAGSRPATASLTLGGFQVASGTINVPTGPARGFLSRLRERLRSRR